MQRYVEVIGENGEHRRLGYIVVKTGESQRVLPNAVVQKFEVPSSGALVPTTEGSTRPVSLVVNNAVELRVT